MGISVGIDLGTTNSVTCIKKIKVSPILNAEREELTPSCVTAVSNSDYLVGRPSRDLLKQYPEQTIMSIKRLMGREFEDTEVQDIINNNIASYPITTDPSEPGSIRIPLGGKMQTPEMISSLILNKLIRDGEAELQGKITQAVVTVPAYFSDRQKFATRAACDYAGIHLLRLLPEPTAAALSFGLELGPDESRTIMVFDLGGGTFDISVLSFSGGSFMEITKGGDMWLGGDNIDKLLVDHVFNAAEKMAGCKPIPELLDKLSSADKARFLVEIKEKAELAKITLSSADSATIDLFGILKDEKKQFIDIDITLTRAEFDKLVEPIAKKVSAMTHQILHEIRFEPELIDTVLMVGGSSLVPAIQNELKKIFGQEKVMIHPRPMLAIAEGAAIMAANMTSADSAEKSFTMMHTAAHDYYLQLANGKKHRLVARNTPLPFSIEEKLTFSQANQSLARLRVFNEVEGVLDTVGELWFHKPSEQRKNHSSEPAKLMLRFSVDEDNIITMKAWALENEQLSVEAQIARGGLAAKLYNDLERTLSSILAHAQSESFEIDTLELSRQVVTTILSASDPITGETRLDKKQKAQQQIKTLKELQNKDIKPLNYYQFLQSAYHQSKDILSEKDKKRMNQLLNKLNQALEDLTDINLFVKLDKELDKFYDDVPVTSDLAHAESAALCFDKNDPGEAKQIRRLANQLRNAYQTSNKMLIEKESNALLSYLHSNLSWSDDPTRRFDRDVCI